VLNRPVLRLPDFLERPQEKPRSLELAVLSDLPEDPASVQQIERVIRAALAGSPRAETRISVFAMAANCRALYAPFKSESRVWIAPAPSIVDPQMSPWFASLTQALREHAADAVHFICRASTVAGRPTLCLTDPPQSGRPALRRDHSTSEVPTVLTKVGAWAALFSLPRAEVPINLRLFADACAQIRPGAVLFDDDTDLVPLYRFMFSPQPANPPRLGSGFLYCPPAIVMPFTDPTVANVPALTRNAHLFLDAAATVSGNSTLRTAANVAGKVVAVIPSIAEFVRLRAPAAPEGPGATPTLAAAQRYVETAALDVVRRRSADPLLADRVKSLLQPSSTTAGAPADQIRASEITDRTLSELQEIIAKHAPGAE